MGTKATLTKQIVAKDTVATILTEPQKKKLSVFLLGALVVAVLVGFCAYLLHPTTVVIAVSPVDGDEAKLITAYGEALRQRRMDLRVNILPCDSLRQSAEALQNRRADLAVVRPDVLLPIDGLTVTVLHEDAAIFIAPAQANMTDVSDLAQHKLGVIVQHEADTFAIAALLTHYDLAPPRVMLVPLTLASAAAALGLQQVDAVALFAAPGDTTLSLLVKSLNKTTDRKMSVLAMSEAAAIAEEMPKFSEIEIPKGGLGGARKQPPDIVKTVAVSYRLMARSDLDRPTVAHIVQTLFEMRSRLARSSPLAYRMKAIEPDSATGATLPNHPGAIDYFAREDKTFFERYGDWIYILMLAGGGVGSTLAWVRQRMVKRRREIIDDVMDRLLALLAESRSAHNNHDLDIIAAEVDSLATQMVQQARKETTGARTMRALTLAMNSVRSAIMDRRIQVNSTHPDAPQ